MKQIIIASGKGGTGKTSISAAFASLAPRAVFADCDVDASDLHLILSPKIIDQENFVCGKEARIVSSKCNSCGLCYQFCRFEAIIPKLEDKSYAVNSVACDGCGVCVQHCPEKAIDFIDKESGMCFHSHTRFGPLIHAQLYPGGENSGKLVSLVRNKAIELAQASNMDFILIDGPPGIGCPVIASITACDALLAVVEPSLSSLHDAKRLLQLSKHFAIPSFVVINKWDISPQLTKIMEAEFKSMGTEVLGKLPYNQLFTKAMIQAQTIVEYDSTGELSHSLRSIWKILSQKNEYQPYLIKKEGIL